jgi:DNA ligase-1
MYTRNGHQVVGVEHITKALTDRGITSLDGELVIPGEHFQVSSGQIRSDNPSSNAVYYVFDNALPNISFKDRLAKLNALDLPSCVKLVKHIPVTSLDAIDRNFHKALDAGYEGLVLKSASHLYKPSRSKDWLKVKAVRGIELQIISVFEGEGKWQGMAGGCICLYKDQEVRASSGRLTDTDKTYVWENQDKYIGQNIEVLYHEETPTGSLRHPRMKSKHTRGDL